MKDIFWLKWGCAMYRRDFQDKSKSEHNLYEVLSAIIFFPLPYFFNPSVSLWPLNSSKYLAIGVSPVWMYMYILHHCVTWSHWNYQITCHISSLQSGVIKLKSLYTHIVLPIYDLCLALKKATFGSLLLLQTFFHLEFGIQKIYQKKIQTDHIQSKV